jgi:sialic acid synthase SpsE
MQMPEFIAEVSSNHNRDIERMKEFIQVSADIGCTGVKFQLFKIDSLFAPEILSKSAMHRQRADWELPIEFLPELAEFSRKCGVKFSCTPFYLEAVDILEPYVDFFKIASYELMWLELFEKCVRTEKPLVFSTGMSTLAEVQKTLNLVLQSACRDITILHCNSAYPTPLVDANLAGILRLVELVKVTENPNNASVKVGYSDHTVSPAVIYRAVHHYNVDFIEFHIDLDGTGEEYSSGHCWLPDQMSKVISDVSAGTLADGTGRFEPSPSEIPDRDWRADPSDGLRPLKHLREGYGG